MRTSPSIFRGGCRAPVGRSLSRDLAVDVQGTSLPPFPAEFLICPPAQNVDIRRLYTLLFEFPQLELLGPHSSMNHLSVFMSSEIVAKKAAQDREMTYLQS